MNVPMQKQNIEIERQITFRNERDKKSTGKAPEAEDLLLLTKELLHDYYKGDYTRWFSLLDPECIWLGTGEPLLIGADAIRLHFKRYASHPVPNIYSEEYHLAAPMGNQAVQVYGTNVVGPEDDRFRVNSFFTFTWRIQDGNPRLVSHHFSYEFLNPENSIHNQMVPLDLTTRKFIQGLLLNRPQHMRIPIKSNRELLYLDPSTVIYIQKEGRHSELVCLDRVINSTMTLEELEELLPTEFYRFHRSYLVNTRYVMSLRRYELSLVAGILLPVPERTYMKVKKELQEKMDHFSSPICL